MIVVSYPKGGNTSLTKLFGFPCERRFTVGKPMPPMRELKPPLGAHSELSWMAAPYVPNMLAAGVPLLHVVRHPLRVIASLCTQGFWSTEHKAYREFVISKVPACAGQSPIEASALLWLRWSSFCKGAPSVRLEDIRDAPRLNVGPKLELEWRDIGDEQVRTEVLEMAIDYGYSESIDNE